MPPIERDPRSFWLVTATTAVVAAPHVANLSWPVNAFFFALLGWRILAKFRPAWLPGKKRLLALTLAAVTLVILDNRGILGRDAGTSAFMVTLALKMLELRSRRDAYVVTFLAFFVAVTQLLFAEHLFMAAYVMGVCWLLVSTLISLNSRTLPTRSVARLGAALIVQALPVMVLLFLFFPRIPTPQWGLRDDARHAVSGLSDTLEPGAISRLSLSDATAFRVHFEGRIPPPPERYWRGPVFWHTDGRRWTLLPLQAGPEAPLRSGETRYRYAVILEPHRQKWLFALDLPVSAPPGARLTAERVLVSATRVTERTSYRAESAPVGSATLSRTQRAWGLQLAEPPSPAVRELIAGWRRSGVDGGNLIRQALRYFHTGGFVYTLRPPPLGERPVEDFLFRTRRGFCEHYATAFVYLMRAAGLPARIVTGYQGGEYNRLGGFFTVRQADAHAWAEVWLDGRGWVRVDPTAAVAPERIERGIDPARQLAAGAVVFHLDEGGPVARWLTRTRQLWSSLDYAWNRWVLSYDAARQSRLLGRLGIAGLRDRLALLLGSFTALLGLLSAWILRRQSNRQDRVVRLYQRFCRKLARRGLHRLPSEGACDFARRAAARLPHRAREIGEITGLFLALRYGRRAPPDSGRRLRQLVRAFRA